MRKRERNSIKGKRENRKRKREKRKRKEDERNTLHLNNKLTCTFFMAHTIYQYAKPYKLATRCTFPGYPTLFSPSIV